MATLECRVFGSKKHLLVLADNEEESKMIDAMLGKTIPSPCCGEVTLSDGYDKHYIRLQAGAKPVKEES